MLVSDKSLREHYETAYNFAYYKLGSRQYAEDVASQAVNLFALKSDMISPDKAQAWIRSTCLNYCRKYFVEKQHQSKMVNHVQQELLEFYHEGHEDEANELQEKFRNSLNKLNELETRSLVLYFKSGQNIKKMSEMIGENYSSLRKRIFRIKQKLKAETYRELGFLATRRIVTPQMHEAILQFVKRFKKNLDAGTIEKMFYNLSEANLEDYNPQFDIQKVRDYEVILKKGEYTIFMMYMDSKNDMNNFVFRFYVNSKNQIKITDLPRRSRMITLADNSMQAAKIKELLKKSPENSKGKVRISSEMIRKITADYQN